MTLKIAITADWHLGYADGHHRDPRTDLDVRVIDGLRAVNDIVGQMIDSQINHVIIAGDASHTPQPSIPVLVFARKQIDRLHAAGITVDVVAGNHDASKQKRESASVAALEDPLRGCRAVLEPVAQLSVPGVDGVFISVISHYGLIGAERIVPTPVEGAVNILAAHGEALIPGHPLFACVDGMVSQPIGLDLLTNNDWDFKALGHYHSMGPLPGIGETNDHTAIPLTGLDNSEWAQGLSGHGQAWYAGSLLRRGWSDAPGGRGWLELEIHENRSTRVTPHYIQQRPQHDLPAIDAAGLTGPDIHDVISAHLDQIDPDQALIRQVITNVTAAQKQTMGQADLAARCRNAHWWKIDARTISSKPSPPGGQPLEPIDAPSLATAATSDLVEGWRTYANQWAAASGINQALHNELVADGELLLRDAVTQTRERITA